MADADPDAASEGIYERRETPDDKRKADAAEVKLWLDALALADKEEADWRKDASKVVQRYRGEADYATKRYRLLFANVQTMAPALYNSEPIPDIRRRFGDRDEDAKQIAQALERTVSCQAEKSDLDSVMEEMTLHRLLPGRAVTRVRHTRKPNEDGMGIAYECVEFEPIAWEDFRRGPAKRWEDVPWVAFRLYLTRDQLEGVIEEAGGDASLAERIPLNATVSGMKKDGESAQPPTIFKRAEVWQFWDKDTKSLVYICPDFKDAPVAKVPDTMQLEGFYPCPRPMMALRSPDSLVPVTEYSQYSRLADDLEDATVRLAALVSAARARGVAAKELGPAFAAMSDLDDGQVAASDEAFALAQNGKIDDAIWFWPIEKIVIAIRELYLAREEIKKTIYEVMGLSDILRGSTKSNETLGAQQIKAQWGSARLQRAQADVARFGRDLFRLAVEIISTKFGPQSIMLASGVDLTPKQVELLRRDVMREYRIDVETDSTIRADLTRHQENMGQFVQGFAALVQAFGPVVEAGMLPGDVAASIMSGFARNFKLGKQAEDALDKLADDAQKQAQQPQQKPPSPEEMKAQQEAQRGQAELQLKAQDQQATHQREDAKFAFEQKKHADEMAMQQNQQQEEAMVNERVEMAKLAHADKSGERDFQMKQMDAQRQQHVEDRSFDLQRTESEHKRKTEDIASGQVQGEQNTALAAALTPVLEQIGAGLQAQAQATAQLSQAVMAETELVRDASGKAAGTRKKPPQATVN